MIARYSARLRRVRKWFRRSEWGVSWLGLSRSEGTETEPGLVLIQIDGLGQKVFQEAVAAGKLPFLRRLLQRDHYRPYRFYSGLPSSTPAVQAELFYGKRTAVPSFSFWARQQKAIVRMYDQAAAWNLERKLAEEGEGLLAGGSAYCDIFSGGAAEAHFCASTIGWSHLFQSTGPSRLAALIFWHGWSLVRVVCLAVVELLLALVDLVRGVIRGHEIWPEVKFLGSRVAVSIVLRELAVIGASLDVTRGLPIVHVNFLGYDEQAHRRGPWSAFALWTLKGIDGAIRRIANEARRSQGRDYDIWVYSDHGQEGALPYWYVAGCPLKETVRRLVHDATETGRVKRRPLAGAQGARAKWMGSGRWTRRIWRYPPPGDTEADGVQVAAMGPLAHVYLPEDSEVDRESLARRLVGEGEVPLVLIAGQAGRAVAINRQGRFELPDQAAEVLGADHPLLDDVARDLVEVCHHLDAGSLVLSGWRVGERPVSFPFEWGAHGGPGTMETSGFALLPSDIPVTLSAEGGMRPMDLRRAVEEFFGRRPTSRLPSHRAPAVHAGPGAAPAERPMRVMTYNVHSCIGLDGKISPQRIARVVRQCRADVVALQELDLRRARTSHFDQAQEIARLLEMDFHFHPAWNLEEEAYGDAVLSRLPIRLVRSATLPRSPNNPRAEPRGALWVELDLVERPVQLINTHLGLGRRERMAQVSALLGPDWISHPACGWPTIVLGDFNSNPWSPVYRQLANHLLDAQCAVNGHRPRATWLSNRPIHRIDHIFVSAGIHIRRVDVPRTELARVASDHLPLVVELHIE